MNLTLKKLPLGHIFRESNLRRQKLKKRSTWNVFQAKKIIPQQTLLVLQVFLFFNIFPPANFDLCYTDFEGSPFHFHAMYMCVLCILIRHFLRCIFHFVISSGF